LAKSLYLTAAF